jgi:hypothetical protein
MIGPTTTFYDPEHALHAHAHDFHRHWVDPIPFESHTQQHQQHQMRGSVPSGNFPHFEAQGQQRGHVPRSAEPVHTLQNQFHFVPTQVSALRAPPTPRWLDLDFINSTIHLCLPLM